MLMICKMMHNCVCLQARVQELLGGGGGGGGNISTIISGPCVGDTPTPPARRKERFSCILVHFKVLIRVPLVTDHPT